jgi:hypothetical protein
MIDVHYPVNGFNDAHEVIEEATRTGTPICDLIGKGLPTDWSQEQLIAAHLRGECSEGYLAARLKLDLVVVRRLLQGYSKTMLELP